MCLLHGKAVLLEGRRHPSGWTTSAGAAHAFVHHYSGHQDADGQIQIMQDAGTIEHDFAFRLLSHSWSPKGTSMYFYYWAAFWLGPVRA